MMDIIEIAEKARYNITGSSSEEYKMLVSNNKLYVNFNNMILYDIDLNIGEYIEDTCYISQKDMITIQEDGSYVYDKAAIRYNDIFLMNEMKHYKNVINSVYTRPLLAEDLDLNNNPSFIDIMGMKVSDGLKKFYVLNHNTNIRYNIPYYVGLFKTKKSDTYACRVYDYDDRHLWINIIIKKPKVQPINMHMQIIKLGD